MEKVYERNGVNPVFFAEKHLILEVLLKGFLIRSGEGKVFIAEGGSFFLEDHPLGICNFPLVDE